MGSLKKTWNPFDNLQGYPTHLATICGHHTRVTTTIFGILSFKHFELGDFTIFRQNIIENFCQESMIPLDKIFL